MPVVAKKSFPENGSLLLFEIDPSEREQYHSTLRHYPKSMLELKGIRNEQRRNEWLASRYALSIFLGSDSLKSYGKTKFGKPFINNTDYHLSLSHSGNYIAIARCNRAVGIDIQKITEKTERLADRFLSRRESLQIAEKNKLAILHIYWGAKECMYKAYGRKNLSFRDQLYIPAFHYNQHEMHFKGEIQKTGFHTFFEIRAQKIGDFILVYAFEIES